MATGQADPRPQLDARRAALQAETAELKRSRDNLMRELQAYEPMGDEEIDAAWRDSIRQQFAANVTDERTRTRQLAEIIRRQQDIAGPNLGLFDALPEAAIDITGLPEDHQRELYEAFRLQIRYNALTYEVILRVTIDADTAPALAATIDRVVDLPRSRTSPERKNRARKHQPPGPVQVFAMFRVPPAGHAKQPRQFLTSENVAMS